jgi:hypothetical protein
MKQLYEKKQLEEMVKMLREERTDLCLELEDVLDRTV